MDITNSVKVEEEAKEAKPVKTYHYHHFRYLESCRFFQVEVKAEKNAKVLYYKTVVKY